MSENRIKDENYFQIAGWMLNRLKLKGILLEVYAIIYGFSQDGDNEFAGSINYLCEFTGTSRPTVMNALKELTEKDLIIKSTETKNGVVFNRYKVNLQVVKNLYGGSKESCWGVVKNLDGGSKESLPNNIRDNIYSNNNKDNISTAKAQKHKFGEYQHVLLTDQELQKLRAEYENTDELIKYLDEYIEMKGYKAKSHYLCIKKWVVDAVNKNAPKTVKKQDKKPSKQEEELLKMFGGG